MDMVCDAGGGNDYDETGGMARSMEGIPKSQNLNWKDESLWLVSIVGGIG